MKIAHIADLHIGKFVNEFNLIKDQEYILDEIMKIIEEEEIKVLLIAGDVYDRSVPKTEAVTLLNRFLSKLISQNINVMMIAGNHDSPERIGFLDSILDKEGLYIAGTFNGEIKKIEKEDEFGKINFYLLPFVRPTVIKYYFEDKEISSYEDAVKIVIENANIAKDERNILVTHYFVTNGGMSPEISDSESKFNVGGVDNVDCSIFEQFDYTALGHIHGAQKIGKDNIRYAGSPLKYSFSEVFHKKSVSIIDIKEKNNITITKRELKPLHDMRKIKGKLNDLIKEDVYKDTEVDDYIQVTLTDVDELIDPIGTLRNVYKNVMQIILEKNLKEQSSDDLKKIAKKNLSPIELYKEFYEFVTEEEFDKKRENIMEEIINETN